jgi:hypothetical protein
MLATAAAQQNSEEQSLCISKRISEANRDYRLRKVAVVVVAAVVVL